MRKLPTEIAQRKSIWSLSNYERIADDLCRRIASREWTVGQQLPGRQALAGEYGVNLRTIQPAVAHLLNMGLLSAADRKGTYVVRDVTDTDYISPVSSVPTDVDLPALPVSLFKSMANAETVKPVIGVLMLGGFALEDQPSVSAHWGNIVAHAIERYLSALGGRAYFEYVAPHFGPSNSDDIEFHQHSINVQIVVDIMGVFDRQPDYLKQFETQAIPTIIIGASTLVTQLPLVTYDQQHAGYLAAEHLIQCGYRNILFFRPFSARWVDERLDGIRIAMDRYRFSSEALTIYPESPASDDMAFYDTNTKAYRMSPGKFSLADTVFAEELRAFSRDAASGAIIAPNDYLASAVIRMMQSQGIIAGKDCGVIGFDDDRDSREYGLTTVRVPMDAMGVEAAQLASAFLRHEVINYQVRMRSCLIERASTHRVTT